MSFGQLGVIEVVVCRAVHPYALHDAARACIGGNRQRDHLIELALSEGEIDGRASGFARVTLTPMSEIEPPTHFDFGLERRR